MARNINSIDTDSLRRDYETAHQITPDMARGAQQQRGRSRTEIPKPVADKGLLQLARLNQIAVERIIKFLQFTQGRPE